MIKKFIFKTFDKVHIELMNNLVNIRLVSMNMDVNE